MHLSKSKSVSQAIFSLVKHSHGGVSSYKRKAIIIPLSRNSPMIFIDTLSTQTLSTSYVISLTHWCKPRTCLYKRTSTSSRNYKLSLVLMHLMMTKHCIDFLRDCNLNSVSLLELVVNRRASRKHVQERRLTNHP